VCHAGVPMTRLFLALVLLATSSGALQEKQEKKKEPEAVAQTSPPAAASTAQTASAATFSPEQLEQIVAPIALYPDALLAQLLMASTYPLEIVEAARWSAK